MPMNLNPDRIIQEPKKINDFVVEELFHLFVAIFEYAEDRYGNTTSAKMLLDTLGTPGVGAIVADAESYVKLSVGYDKNEQLKSLEKQYSTSNRDLDLAQLLDRINNRK